MSKGVEPGEAAGKAAGSRRRPVFGFLKAVRNGRNLPALRETRILGTDEMGSR